MGPKLWMASRDLRAGRAQARLGGVDRLEGTLHDLTGIGLFVVAVILLFLFDAILGLFTVLVHKLLRRSRSAPAAIAQDA